MTSINNLDLDYVINNCTISGSNHQGLIESLKRSIYQDMTTLDDLNASVIVIKCKSKNKNKYHNYEIVDIHNKDKYESDIYIVLDLENTYFQRLKFCVSNKVARNEKEIKEIGEKANTYLKQLIKNYTSVPDNVPDTSSTPTSDNKEKIDTLEAQLKSLEERYENLEIEKDSLQTENERLEKVNQEQKESLEIEIGAKYELEKDQLEEEKEQLKTANNQLQEEKEHLEATNNQLQEEKEHLKKYYVDLQEKKMQLETTHLEVLDEKGQLKEDNKQFQIKFEADQIIIADQHKEILELQERLNSLTKKQQ